MKFGVFDHLDDSGLPLGEFYENRLRLVEAYERVGIHVYLTAEYHATPLGMSPSPSVLHSAIAQRTRRILFGPLVYTLALYHPLRLAEEICMLDHMSGADTAAVLALPEIADILRAQGLEPTGLGPDAFGRFIREDLVRWKTLTQELGIRAEN